MDGCENRFINDRFAVRLIVAACLLLLALKAPMFIAAGLSRVPVGKDDASLLQAVEYSMAGNGFFIVAQVKETDLFHVTYDYPRTQAPGTMLITRALCGAGLQVLVAYKLARGIAALLGAACWLLLARLFLKRIELVAFAFLIVFYFSWGWVKLGDAAMWCLAPIYFLNLLHIVNSETVTPVRLATLVLIICACEIIWLGGAYLALAAGISLLFVGKAPLRGRLLAGGVLVLAAGVWSKTISMAVAAYAGAGAFSPGISMGFFLFDIPMRHYLPVLKAFFAEGLGAWMPLKWAFGLFASQDAARIAALGAPVLVLSAAGAGAVKSREPGSAVLRFAAIAGIHFAMLFCVLLALSSMFTQEGAEHAQVNGVIQADRYLYHLAPALAIFWIAALGRIVAGPAHGAARRVLRLAVILLAGITLPWVAAHRVRSEFVLPGRTGEPAAVFVEKHRAAAGIAEYKIFDILTKDHWLLGDGRAYKNYYEPEYLALTRNSGPVYVYVVVRRNVQKMPHRPNPQLSTEHALNMARALKLKKLKEWDRGQVALYGGLAAPYAQGSLR
jgi:hypothetical protein